MSGRCGQIVQLTEQLGSSGGACHRHELAVSARRGTDQLTDSLTQRQRHSSPAASLASYLLRTRPAPASRSVLKLRFPCENMVIKTFEYNPV